MLWLAMYNCVLLLKGKSEKNGHVSNEIFYSVVFLQILIDTNDTQETILEKINWKLE